MNPIHRMQDFPFIRSFSDMSLQNWSTKLGALQLLLLTFPYQCPIKINIDLTGELFCTKHGIEELHHGRIIATAQKELMEITGPRA